MSEATIDASDFGPITDAPPDAMPPENANGVVTPRPEGIPLETPAADEPVTPASAADRVRARLRGGRSGAGRAVSEPSASESASRPSKRRKDAPPKPREGALVKPLTELYTSVGLMLAPIDPTCSMAFVENAEACAKSMETLARENETVRRAILALTQTSAWGGVIIAHLPILLMVMMHHGPENMRERVAPMASLMNPAIMKRAAEAQQAGETNGE